MTSRQPLKECRVSLSHVRDDHRTQVRAEMSGEQITNLAEAYADPKQAKLVPPVVLFSSDGKFTDLIVGEGFHRLAAAKQAGKSQVAAIIFSGTERDAVEFGAVTNGTHQAVRFTRADKRKAIRLWFDLALKERPNLAGRKIADILRPFGLTTRKLGARLGVSNALVSQTYSELISAGPAGKSPRRQSTEAATNQGPKKKVKRTPVDPKRIPSDLDHHRIEDDGVETISADEFRDDAAREILGGKSSEEANATAVMKAATAKTKSSPADPKKDDMATDSLDDITSAGKALSALVDTLGSDFGSVHGAVEADAGIASALAELAEFFAANIACHLKELSPAGPKQEG